MDYIKSYCTMPILVLCQTKRQCTVLLPDRVYSHHCFSQLKERFIFNDSSFSKISSKSLFRCSETSSLTEVWRAGNNKCNSSSDVERLCEQEGFQTLFEDDDVRQAKLTFIPNCWYQEFECLVSAIEILISTISTCRVISRIQILNITMPIVDIKNYNYCDAAFLISVIQFLNISNNNCWYQQIDFLVSGCRNMCTLLISTMRISDINNWNYWYKQFQFSISVFQFLIPRIRNFDISNLE